MKIERERFFPLKCPLWIGKRFSPHLYLPFHRLGSRLYPPSLPHHKRVSLHVGGLGIAIIKQSVKKVQLHLGLNKGKLTRAGFESVGFETLHGGNKI